MNAKPPETFGLDRLQTPIGTALLVTDGDGVLRALDWQEYEPRMKVGSGGGIADEGEDIEVLELPIDQALAMIGDGRIVDAKTIMLLQYAALHIFR